jgi:Uma2 family endonuclease
MSASGTLEWPSAPTGSVQDEPLYEVINGERMELPPMSIYAAWLASRIGFRLEGVAEPAGLGRVITEGLFVLDPVNDIRRRPDVAFVCAAKWALNRPLPESGDWEIVPDLTVEVISPNDLFEEVLAKMREYFHFGVRQVWIVTPKSQEIYVYDSPTEPRVLTSSDHLEGGTLLPGLRFLVGSLFQQKLSSAESVG